LARDLGGRQLDGYVETGDGLYVEALEVRIKRRLRPGSSVFRLFFLIVT